MLKLILAVSADGYFARGPEDDMSWTSPADKRAFRLLTSVGAVCGVGSRTWRQMPDLPGRRLVPISRSGLVLSKASAAGKLSEALFGDGPVRADLAIPTTQSLTLGRFAHLHPNGWLLGGPTVAQEALDCCLVDQVYLCRSSAVLHGEQPAFKALYRDDITPWLMRQGERENAGIPWRRAQRIRFDDTLTVDCWSRMDACRS